MPRTKLKEVKSGKAERPENLVVLGERVFEIRPISNRTDENAYQDASELRALFVPLVIRVIGSLSQAGESKLADLIDHITVSGDQVEPQSILDAIAILTKLDLRSILKELFVILPSICTIACHYTDPTVTERDVRRWIKSPLDVNAWQAAVLQITAEDLISEVYELRDSVKGLGAKIALPSLRGSNRPSSNILH